MKRILVTGGPVHKHIDDVKIVTNIFRGGLMVKLATELADLGHAVTYLYPPEAGAQKPQDSRIMPLTHTGFEDYMEQVLKFAPEFDAVVLGAAVANLIPVNTIQGKFPSHNYKPGEPFDLKMMVAPRIIDQVKSVAPNTHLFGFKLLSGAPYEELISAAYGIVLEAKATTVFANDRKHGLDAVYAVTKERGVHSMDRGGIAPWIAKMLDDEYYKTTLDPSRALPDGAVRRVRELIEQYRGKFVQVESGLVFGTVAVRHNGGFVTTGRGKRELDSIAVVSKVDHGKRLVHAAGSRASLNAPLLDWIFKNQKVHRIVHYHEQVEGLPTQPYAPPGTVRDSLRDNQTSFNIAEHGCMLLFDEEGRML